MFFALVCTPTTPGLMIFVSDLGLEISYVPFFYKVAYATLNPCPAKLNNLNFQPLEVVSRYRDPQLQVTENY